MFGFTFWGPLIFSLSWPESRSAYLHAHECEQFWTSRTSRLREWLGLLEFASLPCFAWHASFACVTWLAWLASFTWLDSPGLPVSHCLLACLISCLFACLLAWLVVWLIGKLGTHFLARALGCLHAFGLLRLLILAWLSWFVWIACFACLAWFAGFTCFALLGPFAICLCAPLFTLLACSLCSPLSRFACALRFYVTCLLHFVCRFVGLLALLSFQKLLGLLG